MSDSNAQPLVVDDSLVQRERDFRCGNSVFSDAVWDFYGRVDNPHWGRSQFQLSFRDWEHRPWMQQAIKHYIASELMQGNQLSSVARKLQGFVRLRMFLEDRPEICSFRQVTAETLRNYYEYLVTTNSVRGQPLMGQSVLKAAQVVKEILVRGSIRAWNVPDRPTDVEPLYDEIILKNNRVRSSKETVDRFLRCAQETDDVITGASIILASQLGLRLSEVLTMEAGCLQPIDGEMNIAIFTAKTHKEKFVGYSPPMPGLSRRWNAFHDTPWPCARYQDCPICFCFRKMAASKSRPIRVGPKIGCSSKGMTSRKTVSLCI